MLPPVTCTEYFALLKVCILNYLKIMGNLKEEIYLKILSLSWLQIFVYPSIFVYSGRGEGADSY